jgi:phospholipid/cholesterol/gamma-HCH transport system ATP-binding protein
VEGAESNGRVLEMAGVDVSSARHDRIELTGVEWKVAAGEYWVVGGPHGSGKTDLLMTAAGLHLPATGSMRLFGREIMQMSEKELLQERTRIGFVFKGGGRMFTDLTVAENVALALCYHRNWTMEQAQDKVRQTLDFTELTSVAQERAQTLGSDWQQRVGLARALALKPEVLFLDEPAAGLEPRHRQWWRNCLDKLVAESSHNGGRKLTVIISTNDFTPWHGGSLRYAVIKNKRWQVLGDNEKNPAID